MQIDERAAFEAWAETVGLNHLERGFGERDDYEFVETRRMWAAWRGRAALAATPAAAPVVLPEPAATTTWYDGSLIWESGLTGTVDKFGAKLFTEQQVREILAQAAKDPTE